MPIHCFLRSTFIPLPRSYKPGKVTGSFPLISISPNTALAAARWLTGNGLQASK